MKNEAKKHPMRIFVAFLVILGFLTKIVSEFIHEMGHGVLVLLFGGEILEVYVNPFWPFQHSWIRWNFPGQIGRIELAIVYASGIIFCIIISLFTQTLLLLKEISWFYQLSLAWLSFWTFLNGTGYLILGGIKPFGDIEQLIELKCLTQQVSLAIGLALFIVGLYTLSKIFLDMFSKFFSSKTSRILVIVFWMQIPLYSLFYIL